MASLILIPYMPLFLGIDAGGTRTRAALLNEMGEYLGYGETGSGNPSNIGVEAACERYAEAALKAHLDAGLKEIDLEGCFLACAGVKSEVEAEVIRRRVSESGWISYVDCQVGNDLEAALTGGLIGKPGLALVAGTGSFCLGRDETGHRSRCGGWGWILDDVGGASWLGLRGLQSAAFSSEGRVGKTILLERSLAFLDLTDPDEIQRAVIQQTQPDGIARFAVEVVKAAVEEDEIANQILEQGAAGLAELVATVARQLNWPDGPIALVLCGSVARGGDPYQPLIEKAVLGLGIGISLCEPVFSPVAGAALQAIIQSGQKVESPLIEMLKQTDKEPKC